MKNHLFAFTGLAILMGAANLPAGTAGKIAGRITDMEDSKALIGVNVLLEGTAMGAATDVNGYYVIVNVPPGTYSIRTSMIGYANVITSNVVVAIDLTTTIDVQLRPEVYEGEEVTVVAKRPLVVKDVSASQLNIVDKTIETMPVLDITDVIELQAGVQQGLSIRGGSSRQTTFIVDGFILNDERSNIPYTSVGLNSVSEVRVQTGGFNAEYGNIRSGIIHVITKEGAKSQYGGSLIYQYRPPTPKHFGPSAYDPLTYFTRPYLDPDVAYEGTASGVWDDYTQRQYPSFEGWNAVSEATLNDDDPSNDLTPEGAKRLFQWQHRRRGDIEKPDYIIDGGFGGPVPFIGKALGNLRFYFSYKDQQEMFIIPLSRESYRDSVASLKLTSDLSSNTKLTLTLMDGMIHSVTRYNWKTTPTGRVLRSSYEIADLVSSSSGNSILYMPGWFSPASIERKILGLKINRVLSSHSFYEINLQQNFNRHNAFQIGERDTTKLHEIIPGYKVDEAPYGYWGYGVSGIDGMRIGGWMNLGRDESEITTTQLRFDLTSQLNPSNQIQTGLQIAHNRYDIRSFTSNPGMTTWNREQVYTVSPLRIEAYLQDKLEFEGFIANLGIRFDYSDANSPFYELVDYDKYYKEGYGSQIEEEVETKPAKPNWSFNPRLGVSHPITDNSKLYFNYGHFNTEPSSTYRFRLQREYNGLVTSIGNPNLLREKTIAYELGYSHNLLDRYLLNVAAYYKDVTDQIGWISYQNINASVQYSKPANNNYEDIRGLEITLDKQIGRWFTGFINYTYMVRTFGYFGYTQYFEDPNKQRDYLRQNPYQTRRHPQPYMRANLDLHSPLNWGPKLFEWYPLGGWNLNALSRWTSGSYTTFKPTQKSVIFDNVQWKDTYNIDLRFTKTVRLKRFSLQLYLDIINALNTKFLSFAGFSDNFDYLDYMESLHFSWEDGIEKGNDRVGEYRDWEVDYVPMQSISDLSVVLDPEQRVLYFDQATDKYMQFEDGIWVERSNNWVQKEVLETKAYVDMPNLRYFTFLNPRDIKIGFKITF